MSSLTLQGGLLVDGTGAPARPSDVKVTDGRIEALLSPGARTNGPVLDVSGLVVSPGFIDMHAHSDLAVLHDPEHLAKTLQGVTTEVCGQDGLSYAPASPSVMARMRQQLAGWNGDPDLDYDWDGVGGYLDRVDRGAAVNVAYLVPHGTVRLEVVGEEDRAATPAEISRMQGIIELGLAEGAVGLSAGLTYTPGMYAGDDEMVAMCEPLRRLGGYYCPHHRNYGSRVVEAYRECLDVAVRAQVPVHLAHCHVNFPQNRGRAAEVLAAVEEATAGGADVSLDSYPYLAGATYLHALLPSWAQSGGQEAVLRRLAIAEERSRILHEIEVLGSDGHHGVPMDWTTIVVAGVGDAELAPVVGRSIAEEAARRGAPAGQVYLGLLQADRLRSNCLVVVGNEENVQAVMRHRGHTVGSDGILVGDRPHPRGWGTFPHYLGHYVRDLGVLGLEECIAHMTGNAARRLGLTDRGCVQLGAKADLVVFDPRTIGSSASYVEPRRPPHGVLHVFVEGQATVRDGVRTTAVPGRSIRRQSRGKC